MNGTFEPDDDLRDAVRRRDALVARVCLLRLGAVNRDDLHGAFDADACEWLELVAAGSVPS